MNVAYTSSESAESLPSSDYGLSFPILMECIYDSNMIVFVTGFHHSNRDMYRGVLIARGGYPDDVYNAEETYAEQGWNIKNFKPYTGKVSLSNFN
jgi:multimeric flavodoxin WrbA